MKDGWLSTGKAAQLCSVNPDTVLKWIKRGRLAATRTAGGHYRIEERDLAALIPPSLLEPSTPASEGKPLRCWEYLSRAGDIRDACKNCVVYQIRAAWCFQVTSLECDIGRLKSSCNSAPCKDCAYYRRATGQATNVLVITTDSQLVDSLGQAEHENMALRFARSAYDASAIAWSFRPAFAVVDQELRGHSEPDLLDSLADDPRLPGLRIILAAPKGKASRLGAVPGKGVVSVIEKPFGTDRMVEVIERFPVELLPESSSLAESHRNHPLR